MWKQGIRKQMQHLLFEIDIRILKTCIKNAVEDGL